MASIPATGAIRYTDLNLVKSATARSVRKLSDMYGFAIGVPTSGRIKMSQLRGKSGIQYVNGLKFELLRSYATDTSTITTGYTSDLSSINSATNGIVPINGTMNNYKVVLTGVFRAPETGTYTWNIVADDIAIMWFGNAALSANITSGWLVYSGQTPTSTIDLIAGTYYPMRIIMTEYGGNDSMMVRFQLPNSSTWISSGSQYFFYDPTTPKVIVFRAINYNNSAIWCSEDGKYNALAITRGGASIPYTQTTNGFQEVVFNANHLPNYGIMSFFKCLIDFDVQATSGFTITIVGKSDSQAIYGYRPFAQLRTPGKSSARLVHWITSNTDRFVGVWTSNLPLNEAAGPIGSTSFHVMSTRMKSDGATGTTIDLFIDQNKISLKQNTNGMNPTSVNFIAQTMTECFLGGQSSHQNNNSEPFLGSIREVYIHRTYLTDDDIIDLHNSLTTSYPDIVLSISLPTVTSINTNTVKAVSLNVTWVVTSCFYVRLTWDGGNSVDVFQPTYSSYSVTNLSPGTTYTFTATPYTMLSDAGTPMSISVTTKATQLGDLGVSDVTINSAKLTWTDAIYSYVIITWEGGNSGRLYGVKVYQVNNLNSGTTYTFTVTPYTVNDVAGDASSASTTTIGVPLPKVTAYGESGNYLMQMSAGGFGYANAAYYDYNYLLFMDNQTRTIVVQDGCQVKLWEHPGKLGYSEVYGAGTYNVSGYAPYWVSEFEIWQV
jgi:hypothetical protein